MKQTIEVELTGDEVSTLREWDGNPRYWMGDKLRDALPVPAPERTEYRLIREVGRVDETWPERADEVLVAAHSLRPGDRIEWAIGDWREITEVRPYSNGLMAIHTAEGTLMYLARPVLLAVRR